MGTGVSNMAQAADVVTVTIMIRTLLD